MSDHGTLVWYILYYYSTNCNTIQIWSWCSRYLSSVGNRYPATERFKNVTSFVILLNLAEYRLVLADSAYGRYSARLRRIIVKCSYTFDLLQVLSIAVSRKRGPWKLRPQSPRNSDPSKLKKNDLNSQF